MYLGLDLGRAQANYAATSDGMNFSTGTVTLANFPDLIDKLKPSIMACEYTGRLAERWCLAAEAVNVRSLIMHSVDRRAYTVLIEQSVKTDNMDAQTIAKLLWIWEHPDARALLPLKQHLFSEASKVRDAWQLRALFASVDRLTQLRTAAKQRVGIAGITGNANMVEIWQEFAQSNAAERAAASVVGIAQQQFPREMELLVSIPGIGPKTAAFLCAALLPIERFQQTSIRRGREYNDTYRNLRRYAGLYPKVEQSGKMSKAEYLSRRGSPALRGTLYLCSMSLVRGETTFSRYYERQKASRLYNK